MKERKALVQELAFLLEKGNAHLPFAETVAGIPQELLTVTPPKLPYNIWQLAEHIRITQWDIVEFCISDQHISPKWPDGYWPPAKEKVSPEEWENCLRQVEKDRTRFIAILEDESNDLFRPFAHGDGQHLLREALLIADHTSYHCGEILVLRRLLDCWK